MEVDDSIFELYMEPGASEDSDNEIDYYDLDYEWQVEGYFDANNEFNIQVNFTNAVKISPGLNPDVLTIEIKDMSRIVSREYGMPLEMG